MGSEWWLLVPMVFGAVFGLWSHWVSGSGGWSDAFVRKPNGAAEDPPEVRET